jgi:DNA-directed RNA polymerase subunit RPC12/RpoP
MPSRRLKCDKCGSDQLATRAVTGIERFIMRFTKKRKYLCLACKHKFRAHDRRRFPREPRSGSEPSLSDLRIMR